jgi:diguanylate cyclase (GGDEF)-like protein/PAS domain S-box-containing protein
MRGHGRGSVATRIGGGVLAMLVLVGVAISSGWLALDRANERFRAATTQSQRELTPISTIRGELGPLVTHAFNVVYVGEPPARFEQVAASIDANFREVRRAFPPGEPGRSSALAALDRWTRLRSVVETLRTATVAPAPADLQGAINEFDKMNRELARANRQANRDLAQERAQANVAAHRAAVALLLLGIVSAGIAATVGVLLARSVIIPLRRLRAGVDRIAHGELGRTIGLEQDDEFGDLGAAVDRLAHELSLAQTALEHQALHDGLTGLPNRVLLLDRVAQVSHRVADGQTNAALLLVDLDDFKVMNDTMGHPAGDALLIEMARRLQTELRDVDTAARIGGDEFAVLVEGLAHENETLGVAERIRRAIGEPYEVDGTEVRVQASVGVAIVGAGVATPAELLRNADLAMYAAKQAGKHRCELFHAEMHTTALERATLERALRNALRHDELLLLYQPTIDLVTGRVTGVEALIRWRHPDLGLMAPARFIPLAEETGIIVPLGRWVLRHACAQLREWQRSYPDAFESLAMNVNLSPRQLERPGVVADVQHALEQTGLDPRHLVLELTESTLAGGEELLERLQELRALGVQLAVDDFGTGYSSLAYLRRFPIDILKIDRAFVAGITARHTDATLASTIVELGRMLDLTTVAEGIEEAAQLELLRSLGCRMGQGYFFAKPLSAIDAVDFVTTRSPFPLPPAPKTDRHHAASETDRGVLSALIDHSADAITLVSDEGRLLYASDTTRRLLGWEIADRIGREVFDVVHPDDMDAVMESWISATATPGVKTPLALRLRHADGRWIPVEIVASNMLDEPSVRGLVITIRDRREPTYNAIDGSASASATDG